MRFLSTRGGTAVSLDEALVSGIAEDGGLYLPAELPSFAAEDFAAAASLSEVAEILLRPFFSGSSLAGDLRAILAETFNFPIPTVPLAGEHGRAALLELFHGPTAAFKDVGSVRRAAGDARRGLVSGRAGLGSPGAPADLLGRQRALPVG